MKKYECGGWEEKRNIHSNLDYCNSYQLAHLQLIQNNLTRIHHLRSLYCLNVSTTNSSLTHSSFSNTTKELVR